MHFAFEKVLSAVCIVLWTELNEHDVDSESAVPPKIVFENALEDTVLPEGQKHSSQNIDQDIATFDSNSKQTVSDNFDSNINERDLSSDVTQLCEGQPKPPVRFGFDGWC